MVAAQEGHLDVVRYLVGEHGAPVDATASDGGTALMLAARKGHLQVVKHFSFPGVNCPFSNK